MRSIFFVALIFVAIDCFAADNGILDYYDIAEIGLPEGESSVDAVAIMPNGDVVCALSRSKIYIYSPDDDKWRLFASGLHTPLGIVAISDREIVVGQRPELTRITDTDGDGSGDRFETVTDYWGMSGNYGDWTFGPVMDKHGNLFVGLGSGSIYGRILTREVRGEFSLAGHRGRMNSSVPYRGWILKISPSGEVTPYASGIRQANAPGFDIDDNLLVPDNQGDWVGSTQIYNVKEGGFYGWVPALAWKKGIKKSPQTIPVDELFRMRTPPIVTIPYGDMSNSATQILRDDSAGLFGPFSDQLFIGEMNHARIMRLMVEEIGGELQGAVVDFFSHPSLGLGTNRLALHDDTLWVGQTLQGFWVGGSGLKRITWKGLVPPEVKSINLTKRGFRLTFTKPIRPETIREPSSISVSSYFYNYHPEYGSEKFDLRDEDVISVDVSSDGMQAVIEFDDLQAWRLYDIVLPEVQDVDGNPIVNRRIVYTLNHLKGARAEPQPLPLVTSEPEMGHPAVPAGLRSVGGPQRVSDVVPSLEVIPTRHEADATVEDLADIPVDGYDVRENGELILHYNVAPISLPDGSFKRGHYIHPLYGFDGVLMTEDQPKDHPHHRGLWWAWPQLWIGDRQIGHPWLQEGIDWAVQKVESYTKGDVAVIESDVTWLATELMDNDKPLAVIAEKSKISVHRSTDEYRIIDIEIGLKGLVKGVSIGGSEDNKGYGGFTIRIPLPEDIYITDSKGREAVASWLAPSPKTEWHKYTGSFTPDHKTSVAILAHEGNPGGTPEWTTRTVNSAQNPVFPGTELAILSDNKALVLKYRLIIGNGILSDAQIEQLYRSFSEAT